MARSRFWWAPLFLALLFVTGSAFAMTPNQATQGPEFPPSLESYDDSEIPGIGARLVHRAAAEPFNLVATGIFLLAILHTFFSSTFLAMAHQRSEAHKVRQSSGDAPRNSVSHSAELFHFLGEVEVIFGIWAVALGVAIVAFFDWSTFVFYLSDKVNFTEPMFVVVIMTLASTRPILWLSEAVMGRVAALLGGTLAAWWLTIMTLGPLLGSAITEPAAMTISAMLLARKFYELKPSEAFKYATIALLFVNVSVGGTLTNFAAPPVLMVAGPWGWTTSHMLTHFGVQAIVGILVGNAMYFAFFRKELDRLQESFAVRTLKEEIRRDYVKPEIMESKIDHAAPLVQEELKILSGLKELIDANVDQVRARIEPEFIEDVVNRGIDRELAQTAFDERFEEVKLSRIRSAIPMVLPPEQRAKFIDPDWDAREDSVPWWVIAVHVAFLIWTVLNAHHPPLFIGGMLFFLGFAIVTSPYQNVIDLKPALLVGFFLAGLVVHGGLQAWWIEPVLGSLSALPLMLTATVMTAFNDNAAITFLATLIPGLSDEMKHAVVVGAISGGGLTVIANAPNPAGQAILKRFFDNGVSPLKLLAAALVPTLVVGLSQLLLG